MVLWKAAGGSSSEFQDGAGGRVVCRKEVEKIALRENGFCLVQASNAILLAYVLWRVLISP